MYKYNTQSFWNTWSIQITKLLNHQTIMGKEMEIRDTQIVC